MHAVVVRDEGRDLAGCCVWVCTQGRYNMSLIIPTLCTNPHTTAWQAKQFVFLIQTPLRSLYWGQPSDDVGGGGALRKSTRLSHGLLISTACIVGFEFLFARVSVLLLSERTDLHNLVRFSPSKLPVYAYFFAWLSRLLTTEKVNSPFTRVVDVNGLHRRFRIFARTCERAVAVRTNWFA